MKKMPNKQNIFFSIWISLKKYQINFISSTTIGTTTREQEVF